MKRRLFFIALAILFPCIVWSAFVGNQYDTNNQATADAYVIGLITAPTGGVSIVVVTQVIQGMATTLTTYSSSNSTLATNAVNASPGGNILSYAPKSPMTFYIATNGAAASAQTNNPNYPWGTNDYATVFAKASAGDKISFFPGNFFNVSNLTVPIGVTVEGYNRYDRPNIICASNGLGTVCFFLSDGDTLKDLRIPNHYAAGFGITFNVPFQPIAAGCTNVLIDNCFLQGQQDTLYWDSSTVYTEMVIQNCFITCSNWDVALFSNAGVGGRIKSINNVWLGGSAVTQSRFQFGNIAFTDYGSLVINTNRGGLGSDCGIGGANVILHGTRFNLSDGHGAFVVDSAGLAITNGFYDGDYIDEDTGNAYALTPDRAYSYVSSITTNGFTYTYNTNIFYYSGSGSNDYNVAYTNNPTIGAWTNGVTGKVLGAAFADTYWTFMTAPFDVGGGSDDYSTAKLTLLQLNGATWTVDNGIAPAGTGYFATNTATPILVTNYSVGFFRGALVNSNGMWYSPGGYEGSFTGDGSGLTNITATSWPAPSPVTFTNLTSGQWYSNVSATPILINARAEARFLGSLTGQGAAAEIDLVVKDLFTNSVSFDRNNGAADTTSGGHTAPLTAIVPTNTFYWFTNMSVPGGTADPTGFVYQPIQIMPMR